MILPARSQTWSPTEAELGRLTDVQRAYYEALISPPPILTAEGDFVAPRVGLWPSRAMQLVQLYPPELLELQLEWVWHWGRRGQGPEDDWGPYMWLCLWENYSPPAGARADDSAYWWQYLSGWYHGEYDPERQRNADRRGM